MAFQWCDNLHTTVFTPRDYQVELLASAFEKNTFICLGHKSSKEFIALKLLQELSRQRTLSKKINLYISKDALQKKGPTSMYTMLLLLTDLKVWQENETSPIENFSVDNYDTFILQPQTCLKFLQSGILCLDIVHFMVLEDCHDESVHRNVLPIFKEFVKKLKSCDVPKILGLGGPLHSAGCVLEELDAMLNTLEDDLMCKIETASDIVTVLRYCAKPFEHIVQCAPYEKDSLAFLLEDLICSRIAFLKDHRYDPFEIYGGEQFLDDLKGIPDPKKEPIHILETLLSVLHEMGPWAADRVALHLYQRIEKQKIKTPHERHYLLLGLASTSLILTHTICEQTFRKHLNRKEVIEKYSSPKVKRLFQILRIFKPEEPTTQNVAMHRIKNELEKVDFQKLSRSLEFSCHAVQQVEKQQLESRSIIENLDPLIKYSKSADGYAKSTEEMNSSKFLNSATNFKKRHPNSVGGRNKRRPFVRRQFRDNGEVSDTMCAIIYCNQNHMARVIFELLAEMSRHDVDLKFLRCQYTTDRIADPVTEPKDAETEHRRQEEVLKRFRIHDCNLLIGTSVLEEGIDVPKCNLVVRWDPPITYRSYVQCKGRARAAPAYHIILVGPTYEVNNEVMVYSDQLNDSSHNFICKILETPMNNDCDESDESSENSENALSIQYTFGSEKGTVKILNPEVFTNKPPTSSAITLKEIEDEILAIEDVKCAVDNTATSNNVNNSTEFRLISLDEVAESDTKSSNFMPDNEKNKEKKAFQCELLKSNKIPNSPGDNGLEQKFKEMTETTRQIVNQLAQYREIEKMLLEKCANTEPQETEQISAENFTNCVSAYKPQSELLTGASVDLSTAIALVNKYCSKLPSDTFTKLTPLWRSAVTVRFGHKMHQCTLRLPINSPLKYDIVGLPMPSQILARRMAALQTCIELHKLGELDDNLQPIGKEGFRAIEPDWECFDLEDEDEKIVKQNVEPRPGTTKRRQYYYKRIASEFCDCRPMAGMPCYLYLIDLTLQCPIPEEQNTRGRKVYPPEDALQGFGILTKKKIPKVSSFPIFTRSGEVKVSISLVKNEVVLNETQINCINVFQNYTFTNVLRLKKFLMLFDPDSTENCVFIVPTIKTLNTKVIDWDFLKLIETNAAMMPTVVPEEVRMMREFDANKFKDAVVMPWYRNQDQPQYFYVAEICPQLSPLSCFPGDNYRTFKHYYMLKYGLTIQNVEQPLLDVDHTSARLNFLTPRYVNRKGVALPTSSEETKRAKRENLEQKQILVPELCTVHPFPASLWRTAVCLPCILYRINGLLLADDIRKKVSADIGLGLQEIDDDFKWPMLDFGWSLSEVLKKSKDIKNNLHGENRIISNVDVKPTNFSGNAENEFKEDEDIEDDIKSKKTANELVIEGEKKLQDDNYIEIGTWSNDMANDIKFNARSECTDDDDDEFMKYLPSNVSFCNQQTRYGSPTFWDLSNSNSINGFDQKQDQNRNDFRKNAYAYYSDDSMSSSNDDDYNGNCYSSDEGNINAGRIEFTSKNEAETIETEQEIERRNKQLSIIQATNANERNYQETKNLQIGYNFNDFRTEISDWIVKSVKQFSESIDRLKTEINESGMLVSHDKDLILPLHQSCEKSKHTQTEIDKFKLLLPYVDELDLLRLLIEFDYGLNVEHFAELNEKYLQLHHEEIYEIEGCGDIFDNYNDHNCLSVKNCGNNQLSKHITLNFNLGKELNNKIQISATESLNVKPIEKSVFSFDFQPDLIGHPGPSPSIILQALTMSNANDGINLERLETIGDSFLKYAITTYLYITYENVHEGKLSHLRSKQVANLNLYRLGRRKCLGEYMIATKFEPHDNWLPPCYYVPKELEKELIEAKIPPQHWKLVDLLNIKKLSSAEICKMVREKADILGLCDKGNAEDILINGMDDFNECNDFTCFIPYNLVTQHSIPDKSIADCVEALIGAYLIECGPRGALLFMAWLGIRVLPYTNRRQECKEMHLPGSTKSDDDEMIKVYGSWPPPRSPLLLYAPNANHELESLLVGFDVFESTLGYKFRDRSYLLQAMTHASYTPNRLTDCYQRLEFLGDAVLDYLITRHLYEDPRQHSPGALTDLRSALVNNTIFASLAVRHGFHKYFRHLSPGLNEVIDRFVRIQQENGHSISEEYYLLSEEECDDAEDVEVPKALGDVFESIAGAIFLDSNMSLDIVWQVYSNMMKPEIEQFSNSVPKSPIRELLELEPETAKFSKPEKLADGRRVRVTVEVFCKGTFRGIGRNYRIAKCTAAKCALRQLKKQGLITKKD